MHKSSLTHPSFPYFGFGIFISLVFQRHGHLHVVIDSSHYSCRSRPLPVFPTFFCIFELRSSHINASGLDTSLGLISHIRLHRARSSCILHKMVVDTYPCIRDPDATLHRILTDSFSLLFALLGPVSFATPQEHIGTGPMNIRGRFWIP